MRAPVCEFARRYAESDPLRLHMPGHKGMGPMGVERLDLTEIEGADVLYAPQGILRESQENASRLFGSAKTLYSTEGSSLSIRAMLYLALLWGKERGRSPRILAARNVHRSFVSAAALLDVEVEWLFSECGTLLSCPLRAETVERTLSGMEELPVALYLTSPDYLGNIADLRALSEVCHRHGVLLLVDNAHGAYLHFLPEPSHPLDLGADLCCDSAHKTLSALTGTGYLHISKGAPALLSELAERAMALFASTSPSYLLLQSLDGLNSSLEGDYPRLLAAFAERTEALKRRLTAMGYTPVGQEPLKLTLDTKAYGYRGTDLARILSLSGIVCEFSDRDFLTAMLSPQIGEEGLRRLETALLEIPRRAPLWEPMPPMPHRPERALSIRDAMLCGGTVCAVEDSVGKILADAALSCPPAVPILVCGERITEEAARCFAYFGITHLRTV